MSVHEPVALPDPDVIERLARPEFRIDGPDKVTGRTRYAGDRTLPGTLWAAFLSSNVPYGRIRSIDTGKAQKMAGVQAVITGADTAGARFGRVLYDRPVLCEDVVRMVGDRIAAVAADTPEQAEAAVDAIEVDIEELPAILDPAHALADGAPILHPNPEAYAYGAGTRPQLSHPNIQGRQARRRGAEDIEAVFASAAHVFEGDFSTARTHHGAMEPHATMVSIDDGGIVRVVSTNKAPAKVRDQMSRALGLPPTQIDVDSAAIGGDFGGKGYSVDEFVLYFLAKATGRPVKYVTRYAEELSVYNVRHASRMRLRTAVDRDGRILAHQARMVYDGGAYASAKPMPHVTPAQGMATLAGYRVPNVDTEAIAVYTNSVPGGHVRSPGEVQSVFAGESHLDEIARGLGIDPLDLRLRNVVRSEEDEGALGDRYHNPRAAEAFERLGAEMRWNRPKQPGRGRGVAMCVLHVGTAAGAWNLGLEVGADGGLQVITGMPDQGGGQATLIRRVLAAAASIDESRISFVKRTTIDTPGDPGVGGSWVTHMASRSAQQLGDRLREWVDERIPRALPDAPADVVLKDDWLVDTATGTRLIDFGEVARRLVTPEEPVELSASYNPGMHAPGEAGDADFGAFGVEVSVDAETGTITIHDAVLVVDAGIVINPVAHSGQLEGGFAFGVGTALMEELVVDGGALVGQTLGEVRLPTIRDVPKLRIVLLDPAPGPGAFGAKSAGELSNSQIAPAIANAVADATGVRIRELPLTPERVLAAMRRQAVPA
jgi:CO/xanthine dehydrogenase Mo-binding subunit